MAFIYRTKMANPVSPSATTNTASEPCVLLLTLDSQTWFDEMYARLIESLVSRAKIERASTATAAIRRLSSADEVRPRAVLVTDTGLTEGKHPNDLLDTVLSYVRSGGTIVFCCLFAGFSHAPDFNQFFRTKLSLPWQFGDYYRTTVHLAQTHRVRDVLNKKSNLHKEYSQKAVYLKNAEPDSAVYVPSEESDTESFVFAPHPVNFRQTPVAFTGYGLGWLGYVGDVNTEEGTDEAVLAMCGL
jgi:hypothetical protein